MGRNCTFFQSKQNSLNMPWNDNFNFSYLFVLFLLFTEDEHTMEVPMDTCQEIYRLMKITFECWNETYVKLVQLYFRTQYYQPIPGNKQLFHIPHGVKKKFHMVTLGSRSDDASCSGSTYTHKVGSTSKELKHRVIIKYFSLLGKFL